MTQDKLNKAEEIFCTELDEVLESLSNAIGTGLKYKCIKDSFERKKIKIKSLLQSANEGGEVEIYSNEYSIDFCCPSCHVFFTSEAYDNRKDKCMCGQKLIWPDNQKMFINIDTASPEGDKAVEVTFEKK